MRPSAGVDLSGSVVEESDFLVLNVEAIPRLTKGEAPLVPEAADHTNVGAARGVNLSEHFKALALQDFMDEFLIAEIAAVDIGHNVGDAGFGGRLDDLAVRLWWGKDGEGDC